MPPRQLTLHAYIGNDALQASALKGVYALARLRSPLADQIRERANQFVSSSNLPGDTVTSPIVLDHPSDDAGSTRLLPIELQCPICRCHFQTPVVSVRIVLVSDLLILSVIRLNCGHSFCVTHVLTLLSNASAANNQTPNCPTCRASVVTLPPLNFSLKDCVENWLEGNGYNHSQIDYSEGLRVLAMFFRRM